MPSSLPSSVPSVEVSMLWGHKVRLWLAEPKGPQQGILLSERLALGRRRTRGPDGSTVRAFLVSLVAANWGVERTTSQPAAAMRLAHAGRGRSDGRPAAFALRAVLTERHADEITSLPDIFIVSAFCKCKPRPDFP